MTIKPDVCVQIAQLALVAARTPLAALSSEPGLGSAAVVELWLNSWQSFKQETAPSDRSTTPEVTSHLEECREDPDIDPRNSALTPTFLRH